MITYNFNLDVYTDEICVKNVPITVQAEYDDYGIGSYEYWGIPGRHEEWGWEIHEIYYPEQEYTDEENLAISGAINAEMDNIITGLNKILEEYEVSRAIHRYDP
jgi:hypothetical protein